jgi:hypothetical protein
MAEADRSPKADDAQHTARVRQAAVEAATLLQDHGVSKVCKFAPFVVITVLVIVGCAVLARWKSTPGPGFLHGHICTTYGLGVKYCDVEPDFMAPKRPAQSQFSAPPTSPASAD